MAEIKKINTELQPIDKLLDTSGDAGTSGQILSTTGSGTNWIDNTGGGGTVTGTGADEQVTYWTSSSVIDGDSGFKYNKSSGGYAAVTLSSASAPQLCFKETGSAYTESMRLLRDSDKLKFTYGDNANEEAMTIVGGTGSDVGYVGIGTTSPVQKLHIVSTDGANIILNSNTGAENSGIWMTEGAAASPYTNGVYIHYDGTSNSLKINTGTTSLTTKLTIDRDTGNATFAGSVQAENTLILNGSGNNTINTTNASVRRGTGGEIFLDAPGHAIVNIDTNNNNTDRIFAVRKDAGTSNLFSVNESGDATFAGDVTVNGSHLTLANGTTSAAATDYLYIGGSGLASADAAIYIGNGGGNTTDGYGYRIYYYGTGSGNNNKLIFKSENYQSAEVDMLTFTADGKSTFSQDATFAGTIAAGRNINLSSTDYAYVQGTHTSAADGEYVMRVFGYGDSDFYGSFDILRHDTNDGELRLRQKIAGTNTDVLSIVDGNATFVGNVAVTNILHIEGAATGSPYIDWRQDGAQRAYIQYADTGDDFNISSDGKMTFKTSGESVALTLANTTQNATFAGNVTMTSASSPTFTITDTTQTTTLKAFAQDSNAHIGTWSNHPFIIDSNSTTALTIDTSQNATFAGVVNVPDGSAATPSYNFTSHDGNGMYLEEYDQSNNKEQVSISTDGTRRLKINEAGVWSDQNVYFVGSLRKFGEWWATSGTAGEGFKFSNTADNTVPLNITSSGNATLLGKATSAATVTGDGSTTLTTKGYVDGLITGATIYQGTWDARTSAEGGSGAGGNPDLTAGSAGTSPKINGYYYIVSNSGSATPNDPGTEPDSWHVGDWVVWNSDLGTSGEWQKIDNTSVISGAGTGQKVVKWDGSGTSETLADGPITFSTNDSTFAGDIAVNGGQLVITESSTNNELLIMNTTSDVYADQVWADNGGSIRLRSHNGAFRLYTGGDANSLTANSATEGFSLSASQNANFAGSATIRKSALGGSTAMSDGTLILGAGSTDYFSWRLDSGADLYLDKVYGGVNATVFSIDRSTTNGDITFAGNVEVNGTTIDLDSAASASYIADRANDTSGATYEYKTAGTLKWYTGLRGLSNDNFYIFNNGTSVNTLILDLGTDAATFAGTIASGNISVTGGSGGNGQIDVLRTSGANVRIQSQSATGVLAVTTNHPLHLKTNDTTRVTIAAGGDATFSGAITVGGDITATGADFHLQHPSGGTIFLRRDDTTISDGNTLGAILFQGDDPTDGTFNSGVAIYGKAAGTWASGSYESEFIVQTRNTSGSLVTGLTINESQDTTFAGSITTASGHSISNAGKIIMQSDGTLDWGGAADYGNLTWDTGYAIFAGLSGKGIDFRTNASTLALRLDTSQNATFAGNITFGDGHLIGDDADDNLLIQGSAGENIVIDSAIDIILDADGGDVILKDDTTEFGRLTNNDPGIILKSSATDSSIFIQPNGTGNVYCQTDSLIVTAAEGEAAKLLLRADENDDDGDDWYITNETSNELTFKNDISGSQVTHFSITPSSTVASSIATFEGRIIANGTDVTFNPDADSKAVIKNIGTDAIALFAASGDTLYLGGGDTTGMYLNTAGNATFAGNIYIPQYLIHDGDGDTYLEFAGADRIRLVAGAVEFIDACETTQDYITVGTSSDVDTKLIGGSGYIFIQGSDGYIGINDITPTQELDINADTHITGNLTLEGTLSEEGSGNNKTYKWRTPVSTSWSGGNKNVKFGRIYWCPAHWSSDSPVLNITLQSRYYDGKERKYVVKACYGDVDPTIQQVGITDTRTRIALKVGATTSAGYDYSSQPVYYADLSFVCSAYMRGWAIVESQVPFLTAAPTSTWGGALMDTSLTEPDSAVTFPDNYTTTFAGDVTIDNGASSTLSIYKNDAGAGKISFYNDTTQQVYLLHDSGENFYIHGGSGTQLIFYSGGAESFKLDTSQDATFAGDVITGKVGNAGSGSNITFSTNGMSWVTGNGTMSMNSAGTLSLSHNLLVAGINSTSDITLTSSDLVLSGDSNVVLDTSLSSTQSSGTIIKIGSGTTVAGKYYTLISSGGGTWDVAESETEAYSTGMLGFAIGTSPTSNGMLTNGILYDSSHSFTIGAPLYISETGGTVTNTAPTSSEAVVRVVGYAIDANHIYFCPDNTWVLLD